MSRAPRTAIEAWHHFEPTTYQSLKIDFDVYRVARIPRRTRTRRPAPTNGGCVYFIQAASGPVKIGFTNRDPLQRLNNLQTGNPERLSLLLHLQGDIELECLTHVYFNAYRIRGEWFRYEGELKQWVEEMALEYRP